MKLIYNKIKKRDINYMFLKLNHSYYFYKFYKKTVKFKSKSKFANMQINKP